MKKFVCALAAMVAATLVLPVPQGSATLPKQTTFRDAVHDVRGTFPHKESIDILRVTGWRSGDFLYGRMVVANVMPGRSTQQFVLWIRTPSGVLYLSTARNGALREAPTKVNSSARCDITSVPFNWGVDTNVLTWKMPMSCFAEHPRAWEMGGISSIGGRAAWDQTGGRFSEFTPPFANTP